MDIEAAGGAVTGGLIAGAIEKPTGHAGDDSHGACADCGAETSGNFCANCGQATHVHRILHHLLEEVLHGVMHFDARIWRTLPLLWLNPGKLTREWVEGKRTRYVSPLAMFLFTVFVMFFALSFMPQYEGAAVKMDVAEQRANLAAAEKALVETRADVAADPSRVSGVALAAAERAVAAQRERLAGQSGDVRTDGLKPGSWQANIKDLAKSGESHDGQVKMTVMGQDARPGGHGFGATLLKKLQNPDLALYKLQQTMYKFAFLLAPFSIPFMALLFLWRRGPTLYDHGVFVLYSLTFMAMLLMVMVVSGMVSTWVGGWFGALVVTAGLLSIPAHMFAQLKGAYGLTIFSATWRTAALVVFCNIVLGLFLTAILYLGLGH